MGHRLPQLACRADRIGHDCPGGVEHPATAGQQVTDALGGGIEGFVSELLRAVTECVDRLCGIAQPSPGPAVAVDLDAADGLPPVKA